MDNITHSMAGWALGQAGLKTQTRKGLAALILAANMPDIDVFLGWVPWTPLAIHRGFTHGLVGGVLVMPPILAGLLLLLDRWQVGRGGQFKSGLPMRAGWLVALCYLGALTHPLLDLLTTYSVQLLSPVSMSWYHADGLFIIDLFLWVLVGGSLWWSKKREKRGREWRRPMQIAIGVVLAYIAGNLLITQRANAAVKAASPQADAIFASPPPALFWRRDLVWREGANCYRRGGYDPFKGFAGPSACEPTNMEDPLVRHALKRTPALQKFLRWSILPQADIERSGCTANVSIGDARYGQRRSSRLSREVMVKIC
ncbi:metal-dependent hydrolase [Sphingomonas sinipercae]|uniref:Metal-dependent hydrolase n=1 Tax=Sphingomonas sinipercae TaxID=2714944 RepID=A0A6G7ZPA8_9SPHN|nr:metal-dependent hydrolase [Sphingomonas sinipercae]QIL02765.1 metal-dependent hydrolase [Sphingomonas sinipercae]